MTENKLTERKQKIAAAKKQIKEKAAARKTHGNGNAVTPNKLKLLFTRSEEHTSELQSH